jgi:hypothetical protein
MFVLHITTKSSNNTTIIKVVSKNTNKTCTLQIYDQDASQYFINCFTIFYYIVHDITNIQMDRSCGKNLLIDNVSYKCSCKTTIILFFLGQQES